ncbi:MAG: SpoIID/LytB domain-containing protein, partial [Clostridiales bacterium]|nr:SpoIID/LytB domain-containing protein [Clostridiales bacterium]
EADAGWTEAVMREAWGGSYEQNLEKMRTAVSETEGEVLTFDGALILAAYHTAANEKTRNAAEIPGQEEYVYLQSVPSTEDILADGFLCVEYMEKEAFAAAVAELFSGEEMDAEALPGALVIAKRDSADYVTQVQYGSTVVNGEAVRTALGLRSACFYFSELEGKIRIVTKGIGHGLGFSQYGAQQLAGQGFSYTELLEYYYSDIVIEKTE